MKAVVVALLIAAVAAVQLEAPNDSYKAKADSLKAGLKVIAKQQKFEKDHFKMHSANMAKADAECQALKTKVRKARADQVAGGNQYPPFKTYGGKKWAQWAMPGELFKNYLSTQQQIDWSPRAREIICSNPWSPNRQPGPSKKLLQETAVDFANCKLDAVKN